MPFLPPPSSTSTQRGVFVDLRELADLAVASRGIKLRAHHPSNSVLAGRSASRLRGRGLDFEELRAYQAGDDTRAMDWRVTARTHSPFIRVYKEEKERPVLLIVDQRSSMFFGSVREMKSVTAAKAAAIFAHRVVAESDRIGALVVGSEDIKSLAPKRSQVQVTRILGEICKANQKLVEARASAAGGLDAALEKGLHLAKHDHLIVLISDLMGVGERTRHLATQIRRRNDLMVLWVHDPLEAALPNVGEAVLGDGHLQVQLNTSSEKIQRLFAEDLAERKRRASSFAHHYDVPVLPLTTASDVIDQLRKLLGAFSLARRV